MTQPDANRQSHYALERLFECGRVINRMAEELPNYRDRLAKSLPTDKQQAQDIYGELAKAWGRLRTAIHDTQLLFLELEDETMSAYAGSLYTQLSAFNLMTPDYSKLAAVLRDFSGRLPTPQTVNAASIGRLMNRVRLGYYPTDPDNIDEMLKAIAFPEGVTTNLFDPCCGCGTALRRLAEGNNCFTFGTELEEGRAEQAQNRLHRVGVGSFFHSTIKHEAFHLIFLNPPYLSLLNEFGTRSRDEKRFLVSSIPYLMPGGLLIYVIPYYRLTEDICRVLCDNLHDISVWRFTAAEFSKHRQVAVMGLRQKRIDGSAQAMELSKLAHAPQRIPCITEVEAGRYPLPAICKKVELFKGAVFNERELARQLKESKSFESAFTQNSIDMMEKRPPLPLSISQVGLIGGSGLINGLMECKYPHIIKGRIIKVKRKATTNEYDEDRETDITTVEETVSNKMIFNILTPEGLLRLA